MLGSRTYIRRFLGRSGHTDSSRGRGRLWPLHVVPGACTALFMLMGAGAFEGVRGQDVPPDSAEAAAPPVIPPDTYEDAQVEALIERARAARGANLAGIRHYEATLRERIYAGVGGRIFRRERGIFDQQRIARVRWEDSGDQTIQWLGLRARVPIVGGTGESAEEIQDEIHEELAEDGDPIPISLDPGNFDLAFDDAVHPLADTAAQFYRYAPGDTLFLTLPSDGRRVTMAEVRVEPREDRIDLIAASLWFDVATGELVRALYRPARPFNLELDEPEDAEDVPGFVKPVEAELKYVAVEYGLYEFEYWLPRRFAMEGEARAGGFLRVPITVEWSMRDYQVNEDVSELTEFASRLPPGWTRSERRVEEDDGTVRYVTLLVPPTDSVLTHPELIDRPLDSEPLEFDEEELAEFRDVLDAVAPQFYQPPVSLRYGIRDGMVRYNRVEGLSLGAIAEAPVGDRTQVWAEARLGVADLEPLGEIGVRRGSDGLGWHAAAYRRLAHTADFDDPFDLPSSFSALVFGDDRAQYYRAWGGEVGWTGQRRRTRPSLRLFAERRSSAERETSFHLLKPLRSAAVPENFRLEPADHAGLQGQVDWFVGTDPSRLALFGVVGAEGARDLDQSRTYGRAFASVGATRALVAGLAGAVEVGGGWASDEVPIERAFFLGGASTLRGFGVGEVVGSRFLYGRAEVANAFPAARVSLFADVADAMFAPGRAFEPDPALGPLQDSMSWGTARTSVGLGVSLLDGILRLDGAWAVRNGSGFTLHAYLDGLF